MGLDEHTASATETKPNQASSTGTRRSEEKAVSMAKTDKGSEDQVSEAAAEALAEATKAALKPQGDTKTVNPRRFKIETKP